MMTRFTASVLAALLLLSVGSLQAADQKSGAQMPALTIYHIEGRRSERIVWLCEELGLPYKLEYKRGDVPGSMQTIREVSPLMPVAPTVRYGDQVIVESAGIIEMLLARHGGGRLRPAVDSPDYPYYLQWMHYAEGSFASRLIADYRVAHDSGATEDAHERLSLRQLGRHGEVRGRLPEQASVLWRRRVLGGGHHDAVPGQLRGRAQSRRPVASIRTCRRG